jgi:hypothetical protein
MDASGRRRGGATFTATRWDLTLTLPLVSCPMPTRGNPRNFSVAMAASQHAHSAKYRCKGGISEQGVDLDPNTQPPADVMPGSLEKADAAASLMCGSGCDDLEADLDLMRTKMRISSIGADANHP